MTDKGPPRVRGPLQDVRVLDLSHVWAGPLAVRMLSDLGAEVVKVEAPYGRGPRQLPAAPIGGWLGGTPGDEPWNDSALFVKLNRNRRSLCLDLKQAQGRALLLQLVARADVLVENFSAHAMRDMGLDYATLCRANPALIYVAISGYGVTGPYARRPAFGPVVEPMSGLTTMLGYGPDEPRNSALALMDPVAAVHAVAAVTGALRERQLSGEGAFVELSLHEGGVAYSGPWLIDQQRGAPPECLGNGHPHMAPHGIYRCRGEDQWLAVACENDEQWHALTLLLQAAGGGSGLDAGWSLARRRRESALIDAAINAWSIGLDKSAAAELLQRQGVPAGPVNAAPDMTADSQTRYRGFFVPYERFDTPMPGNAMHMPGLDSREWTPCPPLGAHNAAVLKDWLDLHDGEIEALVSAQVLLQQPPD